MAKTTDKIEKEFDLLEGEYPWRVFPCHLLTGKHGHIANVHYKDAIVGVLKYVNGEKWQIVWVRQGRDQHENGRGVYVKPEGKDTEPASLVTVSGFCVRYFNDATVKSS